MDAAEHPRDGRIYYVGQTKYPHKRKGQHLDQAARKAFGGEALDAKEEWLFTLEQEGLEPGLEILERVPKAFIRRREQDWITKLRLDGQLLLNTYPLEDDSSDS